MRTILRTIYNSSLEIRADSACATRLRFDLRDRDMAEELTSIGEHMLIEWTTLYHPCALLFYVCLTTCPLFAFLLSFGLSIINCSRVSSAMCHE